MIVSAISLWKQYNVNGLLNESVGAETEKDGKIYCNVSYSGHRVEDGHVRICARFGRPKKVSKLKARDNYQFPTVLFLTDVGGTPDDALMDYFIDRGYAVLIPDYSGTLKTDSGDVMRTVYPDSIAYGNYEQARGLYDLEGLEADETSWFEWTHVALTSLRYLRSRPDVGDIGVVGVRVGGAIAWQTMISPDVKCGVPINSVGWHSFLEMAKFGAPLAHNLKDAQHRYIAAVEAQSYAPYVKCPVLMLCALRDSGFDCDRAYDTYARIGNRDGNALAYSLDSGGCIGPNGLRDLDLFLEKNLQGREIFLPDTLNVSVTETDNGLDITVDCDKEGILEEVGVYYAEADVKTRSMGREWRCVYKQPRGRTVKDGKATCHVTPYAGATAAFVFAYARYLNGFRVMSKITSKRLSNYDADAVKNRRIFSGDDIGCFGVAEYKDVAIGNIFMEADSLPKIVTGYGGIRGAYSVGGIRTYKISSPEYIPNENALLEFDAYAKKTQTIQVAIETADLGKEDECYVCDVDIRGGGKWKRIILKASDFKGERGGAPLDNFREGSALVFRCEDEEAEYVVTNILWL